MNHDEGTRWSGDCHRYRCRRDRGFTGACCDVVRPCAKRVYGPNTPIYITSARSMTCKAAKRAQKTYKWTGENTFTTPSGFRCRPAGRGEIGYRIRCTKRAKAYRIEFEGG